MKAVGRLASLIAVALVMSVLGAPVAAGKPTKGCAKFKPTVPDTDSPKAEEVPDLPVVAVTDKATADDPLLIEFEQEMSIWWYAYSEGRGPIIDGNTYFNVQIDTRRKYVGLHARLEWPLAPQEIDMYLFSGGRMVAWSEAFNQLPAEASGDTGGPGYEYIAGFPAVSCNGFTIESNAMWATPQTAVLKLWLGPVEWKG